MDASDPENANATSPSDHIAPPQNEEAAEHDDVAPPIDSKSSESDSDSSMSGDEDDTPTEWLATSRAKRSTAGNRLNALLQQAQTEEDPEDELALLFAEDENGNEDGGFSDRAGHDSDVQMDSSSDSEQSGPEDELEGEKALQKQEKAEKRAKQKKAIDRIPFVKKNVRIDPTTMKPPPPRPKKKSERVSWLPTLEDAPTRASARAATREKQVALHADLVGRELKRLKTVQSMEKANAAREAKKRPAMTQAERLAEAARVEKANKRSLSRWEESENQREEEQRAKLAALKNRKLDGPVITWWSGWSEWVGDRLSKVGKSLVIEDPKEKASKKRKASEMAEDSEKEKPTEAAAQPEKDLASQTPAVAETPKDEIPKDSLSKDEASKDDASKDNPKDEPTSVVEVPKDQLSNGDQKDIPAAPPVPSPPVEPELELPPTPIVPLQPLPPRSSVLAPPPGLPTQAPHPPPNFYHHHHNAQNPPPYVIAPPMLDGSAPVPGLGFGHGFQAPSPRSGLGGGPFAKPSTPQPQTQPQNQHLSNAQTPARSTPPPFGFPLGQHNYHQNVHNHSNPPPSAQNRPQYPPQSQYPPYRPLVQEIPIEPPKPEPPAITNCGVNYLILQNFDETAIKDKNVQTEIILKRRFQKQSSSKSYLNFFLSTLHQI